MCDSPARSVCGSTGDCPPSLPMNQALESLRIEVGRLKRENAKLNRKIVRFASILKLNNFVELT